MSDKLENLVNGVEETAETETVETVEETVEETETIEETPEDAIEETIEDVHENIVDEIGEAVGAVAEGDENVAEIIDELREDVEDVVEEILPEGVKKKSAAPIIAVVVVLAVLIVGIAAWLGFRKGANKYNDIALPISGYTLEDMAMSNSMTVEDFKTTCGLPEDMPADTTYEAVMYYTPVGKYAELYFGVDFESFKEQVPVAEQTTVTEPKNFVEKIKNIFKPQKAEPITAETPWGAVLDEFTLGDYIVEGQFESFKEYYGFDETITTDTLYKEVRALVEQKDYEIYQEQMQMIEQQQQESAETAQDAQTTDGAEEETADETTESAPEEGVAETAEQTPAE